MKSVRWNTRLAATFIVLIAGCDDGTTVADKLPRVPVNGTITLGGAPLPQGKIQLEPLKGTDGVIAVADITNGKYAIPVSMGPVPGKYKVVISSRAGVKVAEGEVPGGMPKPEPEMVPSKYNLKSELETEVTSSGAKPFDFTLEKK